MANSEHKGFGNMQNVAYGVGTKPHLPVLVVAATVLEKVLGHYLGQYLLLVLGI